MGGSFRLRRSWPVHYGGSLDARARTDATVNAFRVLTQDVGIFTMSYSLENIPVRAGLSGPGPRWSAQPGSTWNVHEWTWQ
ncbi:MAG: hypothetical protein QOF51_3822 [Chloroflexota bacterium]|nr:hypothetical protein [Chloroflexota bacterium]